MPSLNVALVARRNSAWSRPSPFTRLWICGIVASPTPTVPISSDSTRVMVARLSRKRAKVAAATQPAVPPPAMTISRGEDRAMNQQGELPAALHRRKRLHIIRVLALAPEEVAAAAAAAAGGGGGRGGGRRGRRRGGRGASRCRQDRRAVRAGLHRRRRRRRRRWWW